MPRALLYYRGCEEPHVVVHRSQRKVRLENGTIFFEFVDDDGNVVAQANTSDLVHVEVDDHE
jgi:hypothetical protein